MNKKQLILAILVLLLISPLAYAYFENYPPYKFKDGAPNHLESEALVDFDKSNFKSKDGKVVASLKETPDTLDFILQDEKTILVHMNKKDIPLPYFVYQVDLDKNGLKDFIIIYNYNGNGLAAMQDKIEIFLKKIDGPYQKISYDTMASGLKDFVDLDNDGKYEIIITDLFYGDKHNYFTYNIYKFKDYKLVNADANFRDFPKFVWLTNKPNDKDTVHLTKEQRTTHTKGKNSSINYKEIR